jgi:hypothetical protein
MTRLPHEKVIVVCVCLIYRMNVNKAHVIRSRWKAEYCTDRIKIKRYNHKIIVLIHLSFTFDFNKLLYQHGQTLISKKFKQWPVALWHLYQVCIINILHFKYLIYAHLQIVLINCFAYNWVVDIHFRIQRLLRAFK